MYLVPCILNQGALPRLIEIKPAHVVPAIEAVLSENRAAVSRLLEANAEYTWDNLAQPLEALAGRLALQLEFAIFDFRLHLEYDPVRGARIHELLEDVRRGVAVIHPPSFNRFPHGFALIFAGGYSAGYYSYKCAEVLSSDAFSLFEEKGVFDSGTGMRFLCFILEQGGSRDSLELFVEFRGWEPRVDVLLRHGGLAA